MANDDLIDLYGKYLERKRSATERTVTGRCRTLRQADRELPFGLDVALATELEDWIWREGLAPNSRCVDYSALVGFYQWAVKHQVLTFDPTLELERPKAPATAPRVATDDHVGFVVTKAPEPYRLWGKLAAYAGLRAIEIFRLHSEHATANRIHVLRGKGNKTRFVPMHPIVWEAMQGMPAGPITSLASERRLANGFLIYCRRQGMTNMSLHRMRGWHATRSYNRCKDLLAVGRNMGHSKPSTTAGYIELDDSQIRAVIDGLPTFDWRRPFG